jgi:hypothetical protein
VEVVVVAEAEAEAVTPGVVQALSVPRNGNCIPATGLHVGYESGVKAHAAVVVSLVVVLPTVSHPTTDEQAVVKQFVANDTSP